MDGTCERCREGATRGDADVTWERERAEHFLAHASHFARVSSLRGVVGAVLWVALLAEFGRGSRPTGWNLVLWLVVALFLWGVVLGALNALAPFTKPRLGGTYSQRVQESLERDGSA